MSQAVRDFERTYEAAADLDTKQYFIIKLDANGKAALGAGATNLLVGVLQNEPKSGEGALVRHAGTTKVKAGGTIAIGDYVTSDANGKAVATTTAGDVVMGRAIEAAVADDVVEILMTHFKF